MTANDNGKILKTLRAATSGGDALFIDGEKREIIKVWAATLQDDDKAKGPTNRVPKGLPSC